MGICIIKCHGLFIDHADHTSAIHKENAFQERPSQDLILDIGLLIKGTADQCREIKPI